MLFTIDDIAVGFVGLVKNKINDDNEMRYEIKNVVIDSRRAIQGSLFFAIKGEKSDGNNYIQNAIDNGAICIVCEREPDLLKLNNYENVAFFVVKNSIIALQEMARFYRKKLKAKVIGITGNIGKTTTKEMLRVVMSKFYKTYSSIGNYNNHIGLPLSILNTPIDTELLILEMGMNHIGEIDFLTRIARPDVAIITQIASAHIGNFKSQQEIVLGKAEIFNGLQKDGVVILNKNGTFFSQLRSCAKQKGITKILTIGTGDVDINLNKSELCKDGKIKCSVKVDGNDIEYKINSIAKHNATNSLFAFAVGKVFNLNFYEIAKQISCFQVVEGRGNVENIEIDGKKMTIINDCYNSSPEALKSAIHSLNDIKNITSNNKRIVAVIGDMLELGEYSRAFHKEIAGLLIECGIKDVVCIGKECEVIYDDLPNDFNKHYFINVDDFIKEMFNFIQDGDVIMFKASHGMNFVKIITALKNKSQ